MRYENWFISFTMEVHGDTMQQVILRGKWRYDISQIFPKLNQDGYIN